MKLVIDRSKWLRGEGGNKSSLLRIKDNKMCCLGFYCLAIGFSREEIERISTPGHLIRDVGNKPALEPLVTRAIYHHNSEVASAMMVLNDEPDISDAEREEKLKPLFHQIDVEVEFVDEAVA